MDLLTTVDARLNLSLMQPTTNEMTETQSDAMVGLDALEAGNLERARALLVGAGVTVEIGSTKLAGVIVKVTRCVITVTYGHGDKPRTFRKMPGATYWCSKGHYYLTFGEAVTEYDMCS